MLIWVCLLSAVTLLALLLVQSPKTLWCALPSAVAHTAFSRALQHLLGPLSCPGCVYCSAEGICMNGHV